MPILKGEKDVEDNNAVISFLNLVLDQLSNRGIRVHVDDRPQLRPVRSADADADGCNRTRPPRDPLVSEFGTDIACLNRSLSPSCLLVFRGPSTSNGSGKVSHSDWRLACVI